MERRDVVYWGERRFYIPDTGRQIVLEPHQKAVLRYCLKRTDDGLGHLPFQTIMYSCPKKSGKTAIAGMVARWAAETWQRFGEVLCIGNDAEQAMERAFKAAQESIALTPGYLEQRKAIPGYWTTATRLMRCLSNGSRMKAIATDYTGEAGANPILTVFTELWGFIHKNETRFWAEMAPSPTRPDSIRWIETYAGFDGESELLYTLYETCVKNGRQLTAGEMGAVGVFEEAPNPDDPIPCYVNESARMFAYWDEGEVARRMPWQKGENGARYYAAEAATQTPQQLTRLHSNQWVSAESSFIELVWWDACLDPMPPLLPGDNTPIVVALDAAVTGDCFGVLGVSRDPDRTAPPGIAVRFSRKWQPQGGNAIPFGEVEEYVRWLAANFNVIEFAYDQYQLHDMATRLQNAGVGWFRVFGQVGERLMADSDIRKMIMERRTRHDGDPDLREHLANANGKVSTTEDTKLRMVKKSESRKIDLAVCLSMAAKECLRLNV